MSIALANPLLIAGVFLNQAFSASVGVDVAGGDSSGTLIVQNALGAPPGITASLGSGGTVLTIAGTPTVAGNYTFSFQIHNTAVPNTTIFLSYFISVTQVPALPAPSTPNPAPTTILSRFNAFGPPIAFGGSLYAVSADQPLSGPNVAGVLAVYKSPDGTPGSWKPCDYANSPAYSFRGNTFVSIGVGRVGNTIYLAYMDSALANVYVKPFTMGPDTFGAASAAGPAISGNLSDLNLVVRASGACFVRYVRSGSPNLYQYSICTAGTWSSVDTQYDSGSGFSQEYSLLDGPDPLVTDLYANGDVSSWNSTPTGPGLVPAGDFPAANRVQGAYNPLDDSVNFPLIYSAIWNLRGKPSANPTWTFEEVLAASDFAAATEFMGPDGQTQVMIWDNLSGGHLLLLMSLYTGGKWQLPVQVADLTALFGITSIDDGIRGAMISATDAGILFGSTQTVGVTTYDSVMYFLRIPLLFPGTGPSLACPVLNTAALGIPYSGSLVATGGTAPLSFAIVSGALPPGLTLNAATGAITGKPTAAGNFAFVATVTDANGFTATANCSGGTGIMVAGGILIYALNYRELDTAAQIAAAMPIHTSLSGKLIATDHTRKWTRWNIPAISASLMYRQPGELEPVFLFGNNAYTLDAAKLTDDDLGQIFPCYTTYFFVTHDLEGALSYVDPKGNRVPLGSGRKLLAYLKAYIAAQAAQAPGTCQITITPFVDSLLNPWALVGVRTLYNTPKFDLEWGGGMTQGDRIALKFASSPITGTDNGFTLQRLTAFLKRAQRLQIRGAAQ